MAAAPTPLTSSSKRILAFSEIITQTIHKFAPTVLGDVFEETPSDWHELLLPLVMVFPLEHCRSDSEIDAQRVLVFFKHILQFCDGKDPEVRVKRAAEYLRNTPKDMLTTSVFLDATSSVGCNRAVTQHPSSSNATASVSSSPFSDLARMLVAAREIKLLQTVRMVDKVAVSHREDTNGNTTTESVANDAAFPERAAPAKWPLLDKDSQKSFKAMSLPTEPSINCERDYKIQSERHRVTHQFYSEHPEFTSFELNKVPTKTAKSTLRTQAKRMKEKAKHSHMTGKDIVGLFTHVEAMDLSDSLNDLAAKGAARWSSRCSQTLSLSDVRQPIR